MNELFELFAEITSRYLELTRDPDTAPCMRVWSAITYAAREHGFVLLSETYYDYLVEKSKEATNGHK